MPPRKKATTAPKKATPTKSESTGKKTAPPSTKQATPNKRTTRASLRERPSNEAISVHENEDDLHSPAQQIEEENEPPTRSSPFPDEVLKRIFKFCLEDEKEGHYVAQRTLATLLRVNDLFLKLAGPILYQSPTIINVESFFLGSHRSLRADRGYFFGGAEQHGGDIKKYLESLIGGKDTKLPLLDSVEHLRIVSPIVPRIIDGEEVLVTPEYIKALLEHEKYIEPDIYDKTLDILLIERAQDFLTPNLTSISVGSPLRINLDCVKDDEETVQKLVGLQGLFGGAMNMLREYLWRRCQPTEWVEYQNEITGFYRPEKMKRSPIKSPWIKEDEQYIPEIHTIHTACLLPFSVIWGSVNKIVLRKPTDQDVQWKKLFLDRMVAQGDLSREVVDVTTAHDGDSEDIWEDRRMMYMDHTAMTPKVTKTIISNTIRESHPVKFTKPKITAKLKRKLEDETTIDVYGFEEVHGLTQDEYNEVWSRRKEVLKEWKKDKKVDMSYVEEQIKGTGYNLDNDEYTTPPRSPPDDEDDGEEQEEEDEPLSEEAKERRLQRAKLRYWLAFSDYDVIKSLHKEFKYTDRKWLNGNEGSGVRIRFRPMYDMLDLGESYAWRGMDPEWDPVMVW